MAISQEHEQSPFSLLDALYCEEEQWEEEEDECETNNSKSEETETNPSLFPLMLLEQDLFWDDGELLTLFSKEEKQGGLKLGLHSLSSSSSRNEAVEWMLKVNAHYGFCTLTSILAVDYFDRFISSSHFQHDKPWMIQLAAVTCVSIAAKVEETQVPLLLDLQVEGTKYYFEAKTIQKMELLVLSTLEWKMNPVTPLSFLDHIIRRLGLKNHLHWEFFRQCERLLLTLLPDWRFVSYLPSVLATSTMMHVIDQIEPCNPLEYQNQLLSVLNISKEKVHDCYQLIMEMSSKNGDNPHGPSSKRKFEGIMMNNDNDDNIVPSSPSGVIDAYCYLSCESSNDSWAATSSNSSCDNNNNIISISLSSSSSVASASPLINRKKRRVHEQPMPLQLPSLSRVFVDAVGSPR